MRFRFHHHCLVTVACLGMLSTPVLAAKPQDAVVEPAPPANARTLDIRLDSQGSLRGEVRDAAGKPVASAPVWLIERGTLVRQARTSRSGLFALDGLPGGSYRIMTEFARADCRLWAHGTAPPQAGAAILLISDAGLARGQQPMNEVFLFNPFLMGTLIAAAIAIPIAIHNSDDDLPAGS